MSGYLAMVYCYWKNQKGQGMVEYALILALIVVVALAGMGAVGDEVKLIWPKITAGLKGT